MKPSEIFENYAKLALEKGIVKEASPKDKLEDNPRMSAQTAKIISSLYNTKPEMSKGMDYKHTIMEVAHPDPVVIADSYDKLNGLVENNIERQNIMINLVTKPNRGLTNHRKHAEHELLMSLIRISNDLDNRDEHQLRKLSDSCIETLHKKAAGPAASAAAFLGLSGTTWVGISAALVGVLYLQQHMNLPNEGFQRNHDNLIDELDDFLKESIGYFGTGNKYTSEFISQISKFKSRLKEFYDQYRQIRGLITSVEKPKSAEELAELAKSSEYSSIDATVKKFSNMFMSILPMLDMYESNFKQESYKARQIEEKGFLSGVVDKAQFLRGGYGLIADDFDDVVRAIVPYKKSIYELLQVLENGKNLASKALSDLQNSGLDIDKVEKSKAENPESSVKQHDEEARNLLKDLENL